MTDKERRVIREEIARHLLYATGMFDRPAEIKANPEHKLVTAAYQSADMILDRAKTTP